MAAWDPIWDPDAREGTGAGLRPVSWRPGALREWKLQILHSWPLILAMDDTELLTVSQVAEALSASSQTIRNWIRSEQLRAVRIGNRFLIPRNEVDRLRGDVSVTRGESPWDVASDGPVQALPRAVEQRPDTEPAEGRFGG
ncbi:MAG: helix-turn-helix domain-containing protein [Solirubrobacteraceae bacterium]